MDEFQKKIRDLETALRTARNAAKKTAALAAGLRGIIEHASEAVLVIQENGVPFANPNAAKLFGYAEHELKSRPFDQIAHPEDLQLVMERSTECLNAAGHEAGCTFKILAKNGESRWVQMRSEAFAWQDRPAILCFLKDVTSQRSVEDNYRRVMNATSEGFVLLDRNQNITEVNPALVALTGFEPQELVGKRIDQLYDHGRVEFYSASRDHLSFETVFSARNQRPISLLFNRNTLRDESGEAAGYMVFLTDLTELKATQEELRRADLRYHNMYRNAVQGMFQSRLSGELIRVNPAYARFLGYASVEEMLRLKAGAAELYFEPAERQRMLKALKRKGFLANFEVTLRRKDGKPVWGLANYRLNRDEAGDPLIEGIMVDNTKQKRLEEQLRREHRKLRKLSLLDNLTGFFNTRYLYQALDELISASRGSETPFSLIFMDMDNFKSVVDTHGHLNGSQALREVARTIKSVIKKPSFGVAYGGDEFVLVLPGLDKAQATALAESIRQKMRRTTYLEEYALAVKIQASFGLASFPEDAPDRTGLLALADKAMFRVKQTGKGLVGTAF
ncbi:MAG: PAS domain S-box protein [Deltaproteobacteria bacterium]|nr:PAS domain S-box protein [Deltaproteobacteria bacterium]